MKYSDLMKEEEPTAAERMALLPQKRALLLSYVMHVCMHACMYGVRMCACAAAEKRALLPQRRPLPLSIIKVKVCIT